MRKRKKIKFLTKYYRKEEVYDDYILAKSYKQAEKFLKERKESEQIVGIEEWKPKTNEEIFAELRNHYKKLNDEQFGYFLMDYIKLKLNFTKRDFEKNLDLLY